MKKQLDLEQAIAEKQNSKTKYTSAYYPDRLTITYENNGPSLTRQEFSAECDINNIMKNYEATGLLPQQNGREPIYWDADAVPDNLQDAMAGMHYAESLFSQLGAQIRKEFDNNALSFVEFAQNPANKEQLARWGLTTPETAPPAPVRVEVVAPPPTPPAPTGEPPPAK